MTVRFNGEIKSKGTVPKGIGGWWRRLFPTWDKTYPVSFKYDVSLGKYENSWTPFGVPFVIRVSDIGDSIDVRFFVSGIPVYSDVIDLNEALPIKFSASGQKLEGIIEVED